MEHKGSLIAKVFGVFTVKTKLYAQMDFLVMENITYRVNKKNKKHSFDLKGSTFNRKTKINMHPLDFSGVLKDENFLELSAEIGNKLVNLDQSQCR